MPQRISLSLMETLVSLQEEGSISAVARKLGLSQPTVSLSLKRLETLVGKELVTRTAQGSVLTEAGTIIAAWAAPVLAEAHQFERSVATLRDGNAAPLRIAASQTIAEYLLPVWLGVFHAHQGPSADIDVTVGNSVRVMELVEKGKVDLGFVESSSFNTNLGSSIIGTDELTAVVSPDHPWARGTGPISIEDVLSADLVLREEGSGTREVFERAVASSGHSLPKRLTQLSSTSSIKNAVRFAGKVGVLSRLTLKEEAKRGELRLFEISGINLRRKLRAIWRTQNVPSGEALAFLREIAGMHVSS